MAAQYKTRCPHCEAQFKIGEQHLRQARGAVRCGSCLQVFQATDHLLDDVARPPAAPASRATAPAATARQPAPAAEPWAKAVPDETPPPAAPAAASRWTLGEAEEPPAAAPVTEDDPELNDTRVSVGGGMELSDSFLSLGEDDSDTLQHEDFSSMSGAGRTTHSDNADESWAEALLQELEEKQPAAPANASTMALESSEPPQAPLRKAAPLKAAKKPLASHSNDLFEEDFDLFAGEAEASQGAFDDAFDDDTLDDPFSELDDTAPTTARHADNPFARSGTDLRQLLKWSSLSMAALLALAGQYLIFNFDNLARTPQWRPLYTAACDVAGCTLPNPSDLSTLRGTNLIVRAHPAVPDALVVDAILFNHADYQQPFPVIELSFSSLRGQPVASRRFLPAEYLRGELTGMTAMPRDVPIRVSFEIRNPGPDADNYRLQLHPAPTGA